MTAPRDCRPPEGTPDGTMCWLRNDKGDGWCVAIWSHVMGEWLWWFPFGGMKPVSMAREGYRFHSITEPPLD